MKVLQRLSITAMLALVALAQVRIPGPGGPTGTGATASCTPASGYAYCRSLTINHTQVGGATLSNFGTLVSATLGSSRIQSAQCYDVVFTSDSAGTSLIPWEQESCNQSTGTIIDWVAVASVSASSDTVFYVSYDNGSISAARNVGSFAPSGVWDGQYVGVYHLANGSTLATTDSTVNGNSLTNIGSVSAVSGGIDGAAQLSGSNYLNHTNISSINGTSKLTVSMWINYTNSGSHQGMVQQFDSGGLQVLNYGAETITYFDGADFAYDLGSLTVGSWEYLVWVFDGTQTGNAARFVEYLNASTSYPASMNFNGTVPATIGSTSGSFILGWQNPGFGGINAAVAELRLSTTARSSAWITAEYNNQKTGSTFVTVGSEI
jgi:hypothetical protein